MSLLAKATAKTAKGPGTNKTWLQSLFFGGADSARADTIETAITSGIDLARVLESTSAGGSVPLIASPSFGLTTELNDTTFTELASTRFGVPASDAGSVVLIEGVLLFNADAVGVDVTDIQLNASAVGGMIGHTFVEGVDTSANYVQQSKIVFLTAVPHTVIFDTISSAGEFAVVRFSASMLISGGVGAFDYWLEAKANDDTSGNPSYKGGHLRVTYADDTFVAVGT